MMKYRARDIVQVGVFAAITAILSQIAIPIPFSPVPFTMQIMAVVLSALILGSKKAFITQVIYIMLGAIGMPVFAQFSGGFQILVGPSGGFLWAFPLVAYIIGFIRERSTNIKVIILGSLLALFICYSIGAIQLAYVTNISLMASIVTSVIPFVIFDISKILISVVLWNRIKSRIKVGVNL